jgi:hypothetical protein
MNTQYNITLRGGLCGAIWWPVGAKCGMDLNVDFSREASRIVGDKVTLRDVIELIICEKGGDFQEALLTGDTELCVTVQRLSDGRRKSHTRYWPVTAFPSIAEYVDAESFSYDFNGESDE